MSDDAVLDIDPESLTLGDLCDFEAATGELALPVLGELAAAAAAERAPAVSMKAMTGLVWLARRAADPGVAFDDVKAERVSLLLAGGNGTVPDGA